MRHHLTPLEGDWQGTRSNNASPHASGRAGPVVVFGMDACDIDLLLRWVEEGHLPFLRSRLESGAFCRLDSTRNLFSDAPWPSLNTGCSPGRHAFYNHLQIRRGSTEIDRVDAHHCQQLPFWTSLKGSGKKVALVDVPKTFPVEGLEGIQVCAWGEHYPLLHQPASHPPVLAEELARRFGRYPHPREVTLPRSRAQERGILRTLRENLRRKERAVAHLLERDRWDLFFAVFSEIHYAGHQFYHYQEPAHWAHEPNAPDDLRRALLDLHREQDAALARLCKQLPEEARCFLVSVHGFATNHSGNHLMLEVLERLGYYVRRPPEPSPGGVGRLLHATRGLRGLIPRGLRDAINTHLVPESVHDRAYSAEFSGGTDWSRTRAFFLPSDHFQALISVNLRGREPQGTVEPGTEYDAVCRTLQEDLLQLINADTGRPAVTGVVKIADVYAGPNRHELPDLVVQWAEAGRIERVRHPRFETIERPYPELRRTQHAPDGFMIGWGPGIRSGARPERASTLDFAPTILTLLGQPLPTHLEGRVLEELMTPKRQLAAAA